MNTTQRNTYAATQRAVQNRMAAKFIGPVYKALLRQISSFTDDIKSGGLNYARSRLSMEVMNPAMAQTIQQMYLKAGLYTATQVRREISKAKSGKIGNSKTLPAALQTKRIGGFGFNERMTTDILEYFRLHLLEKAVLPISQTTIERINTVLNKAITEGWGVDEIVREIQSTEFRAMTRRRAETIVRTETVRASNYGALAAAHDSEFEYEKVWIEVKDNRTRRSHRHSTGVGGEERGLTEAFSNGLLFPGDPNGAAGETINCRCALAFEAKRDSRGRLIPKKKPQTGVVITLASRLTQIYRRIAAFLNL